MPSKWKVWEAQREKRLSDAFDQAVVLESQERLEDAERIILELDQGPTGAAKVFRLHQLRLARLVAAGESPEVLRQAFIIALEKSWAIYPGPHTQIEADDQERWRGSDLGELIQILGYDPR